MKMLMGRGPGRGRWEMMMLMGIRVMVMMGRDIVWPGVAMASRSLLEHI